MQDHSEKLFESFERLSLDPKLTFFIQSAKGESVRVCFCREKKHPWSISVGDHTKETKRQITRHKVKEVLAAVGANLASLEAEIASHLLLQCAFCDHMIRESTELLGADAVRESIYSTQKMMDELTESVLKTLGQVELDRAHPDSDPSQKEGRTNLRVIRGP